MAKPKKRDNSYWRGRLKRGYADIYDELMDGKIRSVRAACIKAGLIRQPSRADAIKRSWKSASPADRREFVDWLKSGGTKIVIPGNLVDPDGYLRTTAIKVINDVMKAQHNKAGDVMARMGYKKLNPRLGLAMARRWRPTMDFLDRLTAFLSASKS